MKRMVVLFMALFVIGSMVMAQDATEAKPEVDARVKYHFDKNGLNYKITDSGNFAVTVEWPDGRSHLVFVASHTETLNTQEIREIYAFGTETRELTKGMMTEMLVANGQKKIGAWETTTDCNECIFNARISANADFATLKTTIDAVGVTADEFEKKYCNGSDEL